MCRQHKYLHIDSQGLCDHWKFFFRPVGIELCDITAHDLRSAGSGIGKNVKKFPGKIPITRRICMRFEGLFFVVIPEFVLSTWAFTHWLWSSRCRKMGHSVCRPRWGQIQARGKSGGKSQKITHNSANTDAIPLLSRASCSQGLNHHLKYFLNFFAP